MKLYGSGFLILSASAQITLGAPDLSRGELLYNNHCIKCHTSTVHIRTDRKANTMEKLQYQVNRWIKNNNLQWSDEEAADVLAFLNLRYYKLGGQ